MDQAFFFESYIHPYMLFETGDSVLEVGCGVGAQIKIALKRHQVARITGIDISGEQIAKAELLLSREIRNRTVLLCVGSGAELPFPDRTYDAVYIFFVLEHCPDPLTIVTEALRVLKRGGKMYCTEVCNRELYISPYSRVLADYWKAFNRLQRDIGGHPDIGLHLSNIFTDAGFIVEDFSPACAMLDKRMKDKSERDRFLEMWESLFLSAYNMLFSKHLVSEDTPEKIASEFAELRENPDAIFSYSGRQILGRKP